MKTVKVVDTNIILRYLLADHPERYVIAVEFMASVETVFEAAYIPESVLAECVFELLKFYRIPRNGVADKLLGILSFQGIIRDNHFLLCDALERFRSTNLSIVDALVWATARQKGWVVQSFDEELNKRVKAGTQLEERKI